MDHPASLQMTGIYMIPEIKKAWRKPGFTETIRSELG